VPTQWQVSQIRNSRVQLNNLTKADNGGILLPWRSRITCMELPAGIVRIMRNVCDPLAVTHNPFVGNYRKIWHVLEGPFAHRLASLIVRFYLVLLTG
jgi:hypothetical protein